MLEQLYDLLCKGYIEYGYNFVDDRAISTINLWTDGIDLLESGITKIVYCENNYNKKSSSERLADEKNLSDKSNVPINDASFNPLSEMKYLRLRSVNKVIIKNINLNPIQNRGGKKFLPVFPLQLL